MSWTAKDAIAVLSRSSDDFGLALYASARKATGNLALSPLSITTALAMTWGGARGETAEQMKRALRFTGTPSDVMAASGWLATSLADPSLPVKIRIANRLFAETAYQLEPTYLQATQAAYGAAIESVDFRHAAQAARDNINGWVEQQTEQRIRDLIPSGGVDDQTRLVLVNAIYFLGRWAAPFESYATRPRPFFVTKAQSKEVPTMHQRELLRYAEHRGLRAVSLGYRGGTMSMLVVVPTELDGIDALEQSLDAQKLDAIVRSLAPQQVMLALPKFEVNPPASLALADQLVEMGMVDAFDRDKADFTGIANPPNPQDRLFIGEVFHKAFVRVDEEGTEAAAATAVLAPRGAGIPPKAIQLDVDRPFLFFIVHDTSGLVLFMGRVADPSRP